MLKSWYISLDGFQKTVVAVVSILVIFAAFKSGYYTQHYGGTDLRDRVVASRMMDSGRAAYFFKWREGISERLLNPNVDRTSAVNGVTASPGGLLLQSAFAWMDYPRIRMLWTVCQYLFAALIFCFFFANEKNSRDSRYYLICIGVLFFLCTPIWLMYIERGQIYLFYAFLITSLYMLIQRGKKWTSLLGGVVFAIMLYCRPIFAVLVIPLFFLSFDGWMLAGLAVGCIPLGLHAWLHIDLWKGYLEAMRIYMHFDRDKGSTAGLHAINYPRLIEGASNLSFYKKDFICGGISPISRRLSDFGLNLPSNFYLALYGFLVAAATAWYKIRQISPSTSNRLLFGFLLYILAELVLPAPRGAYHMVQWIFPVLVFLHQPRFSRKTLALLVTGLCLINGFTFYFPYCHDLGEVLLLLCLLSYLSSRKIFSWYHHPAHQQA